MLDSKINTDYNLNKCEIHPSIKNIIIFMNMFLEQKLTSSVFLCSYQILTRVQQGTQSIIFLGRKQGKFYGIKVYKNGHVGRKFFDNQAQILESMHDDCIVKPLQTCINDDQQPGINCNLMRQPFLVMQYYKNGDLRNYMNAGTIPYKIRNHLIRSMAKCLLSTQSNRVIHRDIKPENFLVDQTINLKLIDFGAAIKQHQQSLELVGTSNYIAPQIYKSKSYSYKSDIFALGVICFQLIFSSKKAFPFKQAKISDCNFLLIKQQMYDRFWSKFSEVGLLSSQKKFLQKILSPNPDQRPSASQILSQNCFQQTATFQQCQNFLLTIRNSSNFSGFHNYITN